MRNKYVWIFNAGHSFSDNPKWLFVHIVNNHKEITPYWFCYKKELVARIRALGYKACLYNSAEGKRIGSQAGVYVVEQNKELFQDYLEGITILNLWHGVGCKNIEHSLRGGFMEEGIARKHIINERFYQNQLFLVTSPLMEKHFTTQCLIPKENIIRSGYPNSICKTHISTYDHNFLQEKGLGNDTRIVVYAPTFRDYAKQGFIGKAIPDFNRLIHVLEETNSLFIIKVHPQVASDPQLQYIKDQYGTNKYILFWDNKNDLYEVIDQIDVAIIDYSSIFYDFIAKGVKTYIRYVFDLNNGSQLRDFAFNYLDMTCGTICENYDDFLNTLKTTPPTLDEDINRIYDLFWSYSKQSNIDDIISRTLEETPKKYTSLPTLYSYDIFDTLIARSTKSPSGVFYYVQEKLATRNDLFPHYFIQNYFKIRKWCEENCREHFNKTLNERDRTEISFDMIFSRMQDVYSIPEEGINLLKQWELDAEYEVSIPITEQIEILKSQLEAGDDVVLVSDMYLPKDFIKRLLSKADQVLEALPLFLSSDFGYQKTKKRLYAKVYQELDYRYEKWIHTGDNAFADVKMASSMGIQPNHIPQEKFNKYEAGLISFARTFDAHIIARLLSEKRNQEGISTKELFAYCYASLYFVPYVWWAVEDALHHGAECLYFISRDGIILKAIADMIIKENNYCVKTKLIYGSRKLWRIPSLINEVGDEFFGNYGNFVGLDTIDDICSAGAISREQFDNLLPNYKMHTGSEKLPKSKTTAIVSSLSTNSDYKHILLDEAKKQRAIVQEYLKQEINFEEKHVFIEYWGRGYTQTCLARIIQDFTGKIAENIFYYVRSIYPTEGAVIRRNFTGNNWSLIFVESIMANMPYKSVAEYKYKDDGLLGPVIVPCDNDKELYDALIKQLPLFAHDICNANLLDINGLRRALFDYGLSYFNNNKKDNIFQEIVGTLIDSPQIYGQRHEFAPPITVGAIYRSIAKKERFKTSSMEMSLARSKKPIRTLYKIYKKHLKKRLRK